MVDFVDAVDNAALQALATELAFEGCRVYAVRPELVERLRGLYPAVRVVPMTPLGPRDVKAIVDGRLELLDLQADALTLKAWSLLERLCDGNPGRLDQLFARAVHAARAANSPRVASTHVEQAAAALQAPAIDGPTAPPKPASIAPARPADEPSGNEIEFIATALSQKQVAAPSVRSISPPAGVLGQIEGHAADGAREELCQPEVTGSVTPDTKFSALVDDTVVLLARESRPSDIADDLGVATQSAVAPPDASSAYPRGSAWHSLTRPPTPQELARTKRGHRRRLLRAAARVVACAAIVGAAVWFAPDLRSAAHILRARAEQYAAAFEVRVATLLPSDTDSGQHAVVAPKASLEARSPPSLDRPQSAPGTPVAPQERPASAAPPESPAPPKSVASVLIPDAQAAAERPAVGGENTQLAEAASFAAASDHTAAAPPATIPQASAADSPPAGAPASKTRSLTVPDDADAMLMRRGDAMLALGDLLAARLFFERAAQSASGIAARSASMTYDPLYLREIGAKGLRPDPAAAEAWYRKAVALGDSEAAIRLQHLVDQEDH